MKLFVGTYITFLKGYDADYRINSKFWMNLWFEKNFSWGSLCTGGAAVIWAVDFFSTTDFDENIIFVLSKDQTFRIRCTLMNPTQFLILVTHLTIYNIPYSLLIRKSLIFSKFLLYIFFKISSGDVPNHRFIQNGQNSKIAEYINQP